MARYTTRVELHRGVEPDYEVLHAAMERKGFSRFIEGKDGTVYQLPLAEYNFVGSATVDEVLEAGKEAAAQTGKYFGIIVSEATSRRWHGLERSK